MKRETYKGRKIKVVAGRGADWGYTRITLNGVDMGKWMQSEDEALSSTRGTIDHADEVGMGNGRYGAEWYAPGTFELNEYGHVVAPGGICSCDYCEKRRIEPCANITAGGVCVCDHCMKPYLTSSPSDEPNEPTEVTEETPSPASDEPAPLSGVARIVADLARLNDEVEAPLTTPADITDAQGRVWKWRDGLYRHGRSAVPRALLDVA